MKRNSSIFAGVFAVITLLLSALSLPAFAADPGELVIVPQDKDNIRKVLLGKTNQNDVLTTTFSNGDRTYHYFKARRRSNTSYT